jgi:hypothetical protein
MAFQVMRAGSGIVHDESRVAVRRATENGNGALVALINFGSDETWLPEWSDGMGE